MVNDELAAVLRKCAEPANDTTGSEASFELARFWLRECVAHHPDCPKPAQADAFFPTRAVDVGPPDGSQPPRLYDRAAGMPLPPEGARGYVALSHCWGASQPIKTEAATIAARRAGIAMDSLPKTFRHAVLATRRLGFRFVWIDSLCIVQDSKDDWERESKQMCDIYRQAAATVAAAQAAGHGEGCFVGRDG
ncbi:heterokaryon incompatibility protein-domain-containing protein, partial [Lineolata rhizophorae]